MEVDNRISFGSFVKYMWILILLHCQLGNAAEKIIQTFAGAIGAGNYTYFSLHEKGEITLFVESLKGDVDIYAAQTTGKPSYLEYDVQSSTCGLDIVTIPTNFKRPVGIALFGHVYYPVSRYRLTAILDYQGEESSVLRSLRDSWSADILGTNESQGEDGEEEVTVKSVLWTIFIGFLKILFEIIT